MKILFVIIIIGLIIYIVYTKKNNNYHSEHNTKIDTSLYINTTEQYHPQDIIPYHKKYLLTKNEYYFFKKLKPVADKYGYTILTKIRLADLVEVNHGLNKTEWAKYFGKIKSKHVDFALAKPDNLQIDLLIELDDNSHTNETRKIRDEFVDRIYNKTGYRILHVYSGEQELEIKISRAIINTKST